MKNTIYLITNYENLIPQKLHETVGLDLDIIKKKFENSLFFETVISIEIDSLANSLISREIDVKGKYFFFCSSQIESYKLAIFDIASEVSRLGGILVPGLPFYQAHENKFYQELYKSERSIPTPKSKVVTSSSSNFKVKLPTVVKPSFGFGSKGVKLVDSNEELNKSTLAAMKSYLFESLSVPDIARSFIKAKFKYKNRYPRKFGRVVYQDFIPDLKFDWKVLVFGDKVYVLKRFTRVGDFRASGSGNFDYFSHVSDDLIKFSHEVRVMLHTPFVSLDIAESKEGYSIIEYQSVHFGLATVINAKYEFIYNEEKIERVEVDNINVDSLFAESILKFVV